MKSNVHANQAKTLDDLEEFVNVGSCTYDYNCLLEMSDERCFVLMSGKPNQVDTKLPNRAKGNLTRLRCYIYCLMMNLSQGKVFISITTDLKS